MFENVKGVDEVSFLFNAFLHENVMQYNYYVPNKIFIN